MDATDKESLENKMRSVKTVAAVLRRNAGEVNIQLMSER